MKVNFFIILIFLPTILCAQNLISNLNEFNLTGTIKGNTDSIIVLRYINLKGKYIKDTSTIRNGRFTFKGTIMGATNAMISCQTTTNSVDDPNFAEVFLEPSNLIVTIEINHFKDIKISGSKTQNEWIDFKKTIEMVSTKIDSTYQLLLKNREVTELETNQTRKDSLKKEENLLWIKIDSLKKDKKDTELQFIKENPASCVSAHLLFYMYTDFSYTDYRKLYDQLLPNVLNSRIGDNLKVLVTKMTNSKVGAAAPEFSIVDINGEKIKLSSFKNKKVVLVEFWASWCEPCRASFPQLKGIRERYSEEELEIIAITRDLNQNAWKDAILKDNIENWIHCSVFDDYQKDESGMLKLNEIENEYYIPFIPLTILIDQEGIVAGFYAGKTSENYENLVNTLSKLMPKL